MRSVGYELDGTPREGTTIADAAEAVRRGGLAWLPGVYAPDLLTDVLAAITADLPTRDRCEVGPGRSLVAPRLAGALLDERFLASPAVWELAEALLGPTRSLASTSLVLSEPGSGPQTPHADAPIAPGNGLTIAVPLVAVPDACGKTCFWPGSHLRASADDLADLTPVRPPVEVGDVLIWDWRLIHCGTANASAVSRPLFCFTAASSGHRDPNFDRRMLPVIDLDLEGYLTAPLPLRVLLRTAVFTVLNERFALDPDLGAIEVDDPTTRQFVERLTRVPAPRLRDALRIGADLGLEALYCTELLHELAAVEGITF